MLKAKYIKIAISILLISTILSSCSTVDHRKETAQKLSSSETVFEALLPESIPEMDELFLEIIDDVTGIALNPTRFSMERKDDRTYFARIPISTNSVIKYRYVHRSYSDTIEKNSAGAQMLYRIFYAKRPTVVKDIVDSWSGDSKFPATGEISGYVFDQKTDLPVADVIIIVNGNSTISGADGYYVLKNLPVGEFLITAIHPDGKYEPFQQGAVIVENALTPANFGLQPAEMVEVHFEILVPEGTLEGVPIRLVGNTFSTGNLFSELAGGTSIVPSRAPLLTYEGNRKYSLTLELPAGWDFRYKFTLGGGFVNAERTGSGDFFNRQYVVPDRDTTVFNRIEKWARNADEIPVIFTINVPATTPPEDIISIQFNPFVWMQPIPMWHSGESQWTYALYGPFEYLDGAQFRVCRNDQCGEADDYLTAGKNAAGYVLNLDELGSKRKVTYTVEKWIGSEPPDHSVAAAEYAYQKPGFQKIIAFDENYSPLWLPHYEWGMIDTAVSGANTLCISPTIKFSTRDSLSATRVLFDQGFSTAEISELNNYAQQVGLDLILFPQPEFGELLRQDYWSSAPLTYNWWHTWFDSYSRFLLQYAYLSDDLQLPLIVIGGGNVSPALPNGRLPNGKPANTPYDISERWETLIATIRTLFSGDVYFAVPDTFSEIDKYGFLKNVDGVLVITDRAIAPINNSKLEEMRKGVSDFLDQDVAKLNQIYNKPVLIGLDYAAIDGSASNCANHSGNCLALLDKDQANTLPIDLGEQADIYQAFLVEIVSRDWITGVFSMQFSPAVSLADAAASIRGKPAFDVLSYYFNQVIRN